MAQYELILKQNSSVAATVWDEKKVVIAKGGLLSVDSSYVPTALAVGANNKLLTADSAATTGLAWTSLTMPSTIAALSIFAANSLNTLVAVTVAANQSVRLNSGGTAWEAFTPATGGGNVTKVGTPVDSQIGVWTGDGTIEGDALLTYGSGNFLVGSSTSGITLTGYVFQIKTSSVVRVTMNPDMTASGSGTAYLFRTSNTLNTGDKLFSLFENAAERFFINQDGTINTQMTGTLYAPILASASGVLSRVAAATGYLYNDGSGNVSWTSVSGTPLTDGILDGTGMLYAPYSDANKAAGRFYTYSATAPTNTTWIAWDGYFYVTRIYVGNGNTFLSANGCTIGNFIVSDTGTTININNNQRAFSLYSTAATGATVYPSYVTGMSTSYTTAAVVGGALSVTAGVGNAMSTAQAGGGGALNLTAGAGGVGTGQMGGNGGNVYLKSGSGGTGSVQGDAGHTIITVGTGQTAGNVFIYGGGNLYLGYTEGSAAQGTVRCGGDLFLDIYTYKAGKVLTGQALNTAVITNSTVETAAFYTQTITEAVYDARAGKRIFRYSMSGYYTASSGGTLTIRLKIGGTTLITAVTSSSTAEHIKMVFEVGPVSSSNWAGSVCTVETASTAKTVVVTTVAASGNNITLTAQSNQATSSFTLVTSVMEIIDDFS
jgi:hypothetical protein